MKRANNDSMEGEGFFSVALPNGGSKRQKALLCKLASGHKVTGPEMAKLIVWRNMSEKAINENYQVKGLNKQAYLLRNDEADQALPLAIPIRNWDNYSTLIEKASTYNEQQSPEPERDQAYSKVTTSPMPIAA